MRQKSGREKGGGGGHALGGGGKWGAAEGQEGCAGGEVGRGSRMMANAEGSCVCMEETDAATKLTYADVCC
jgi:hypothetical protein